MSINIFIKNIFDKFKEILNKNGNNEVKNRKILTDNIKKIEIIDEKTNNDTNECKENKKNFIIDNHYDFVKESFKDGINLSEVDINVWYEFNRYNLSQFTRERMEEYENILYEVMKQMQEYYEENNILLFNHWFENNNKNIENDISFIIRYSENLLRNKFNYKRMLSYDKFQNITSLKLYFDNKFDYIINMRINEIESNIPEMLFDLDIEDIELKHNTVDIESISNNLKNNLDDNLNKQHKEFLEVDENLFIDDEELDKLIEDIDNFEI